MDTQKAHNARLKELFKALRTYKILFLACLLLLACRESKSTLPFDPLIEDMTLVRLVNGDEATMAINRLHGMPIQMERGFIAHYAGVHDKATIWVSEAASEDLADEQIRIMIDKMKGNRRSPFSGYRMLQADGMEVIAFNGMGQVHYVFREEAWVYWVSGDRGRIDKLLEHIQRTG